MLKQVVLVSFNSFASFCALSVCATLNYTTACPVRINGLKTKADLTSSILASVNGSLPALSPSEKQPAFLNMLCHL
jgi:hypothetical protein